MTQTTELKITVVIPCYNASKTINKCIESVINQTYKADEIILIDDCSTDNTWEVLKDIQKYNNHLIEIKLTSTGKNSGPSVARNIGVKMANTNWIAFLDSDDYWDKTKLEKQVAIFHKEKNVKLISCAYKKKKLPDSVPYQEINFKQSFIKNYFETPTVFAEKKVLEEFPFNPDQKHSEDYMVWLKITKNYKAICLNEILAFCVLDKNPYGESGLSQNIWKMEKGELSNFKILYKDKDINFWEYLAFSSFSLLKFFRRFLIVTKRNLF
ncbi:glycosyltransferase family 2 protein [Moheibacter lacus]|uniref:Glycosyltransferase family 2 protein n=1 Tax=Moheibacter lacus TaxID=2745851 RepID=A0A838ZRQ7_9FLAO|nr:glycosyltransferase family 2 protein [Moheibacter lacus]MBA5629203.1 glycosyltransferase family 2 protein [Moheibacter lacus]